MDTYVKFDIKFEAKEDAFIIKPYVVSRMNILLIVIIMNATYVNIARVNFDTGLLVNMHDSIIAACVRIAIRFPYSS